MFRTAGQTFWTCTSRDGQAGMAWDWVELGRGVFALADPMAVMTNLRFIDAGGELLGRTDALRHVNAMVHALPWQDAVGRHLDALGADVHPDQRVSQRPGVWQKPAAGEARPSISAPTH